MELKSTAVTTDAVEVDELDGEEVSLSDFVGNVDVLGVTEAEVPSEEKATETPIPDILVVVDVVVVIVVDLTVVVGVDLGVVEGG